MTRDPTTEKAIVSDNYYKWTNTNAFSWTLHNTATYLKNITFFNVVKSNILGTILNTQNMQETNVYLNNS